MIAALSLPAPLSLVFRNPTHAFRLLLASVLLAATAEAQKNSDENALSFSGDVRLRFESDWDSQNSAGNPRDDRKRWRIRLRGNAGLQLSDQWSMGARLRTGDRDNQQSPHLTFASNSGGTDDVNLVFDRYFLSYQNAGISGWFGRNSMPFWKQNEFFWDDDVTPTGIALSIRPNNRNSAITTHWGAFLLPDGVYGLHGSMLSGQVKYDAPIAAGKLTLAAGLHNMSGKSGAENLRNRNGTRDYLIGVLGVQWTPNPDKLPLVLGLDVFENFANYNGEDTAPFPASDADETSAYVFSLKYGSLSGPGSWQFAYAYAHVEAFAVNASYAQDDWFRFGSATQTDSSDYSGHEFRFTYSINNKVNVVTRLFLVDAISTIQDGNRFRIDLNCKF